MIQLGSLSSQSLFQFVQISDEYFVQLLLHYSTHAVIYWIRIWRIWRHISGWINSGVSFSNKITQWCHVHDKHFKF